MSGHRAIQYDPDGQPRAAGHSFTGLVRLLYANRAKVNVVVRSSTAADVEAKAAEAVAEVESGNLEDKMAMQLVWEDWLGWVVWLGVHLVLTGEL